MPQTSIVRCTMGAAMMSVVVGGLAYGTAKEQCDQQQAKFQSLAQEECLANDPSRIMTAAENATEQDEINRIRRLHALHDICAYGLRPVPA